ncbi:KorB domain-containing protein [Asticcacaulis benevestitus]|uniref:Repressor KorB domain-containing protein n=1 Tax=Asticcacaulis benevestitus DSM 16100 = ATCC BAA-896 TaxID=1121022 RepID=V4PYL9_9CAUL|nr:KorB domain-containing protein [Asticcacaulis benevestitus]ESQ92539.1 hypothetical protein ABENE_07840 [Asticcacaulis benevestitus DSM 16100 = ATCC BAA-896]
MKPIPIYDQVIENLQRDDLKPLELANFIRGKLKSGDKKAHIARQLGIDASTVTQHLALIDPPACLEAVYTSGRCQSPKTLYDLRTLHESHPEAVIAWCATSTEITRRTVAGLAETLKASPVSMASAPLIEDDSERSAPIGTHEADAACRPPEALTQNVAISVELDAVPVAVPEVWVDVEGRRAQLVLDQCPVQPDHVFVRFEGSPKDEPVRAGGCRLIQLTDKHEA